MMEYFEQKLERDTLYTGKILNLHRDKVLLQNGSEAFREVVEHPGGAAVLAILPDARVLFVRQYRYAAGQSLLELPAGKLEPGEDPAACAARELEEETGWRAGSIFKLGQFFPTPGYDNEILYLFAAKELTPSHQNLDPDEALEVVTMPLDEALSLVSNGGITDAKTALALLLFPHQL